MPIEILEKLVSIGSQNPPGALVTSGGTEILEYVANFLQKIPRATVIRQSLSSTKGNVIAIFGSPQILVNAHLDTVPTQSLWRSNPFKLIKKGKNLYGLGACDVKGGVASILSAILEHPPHNLALLFNSDEEYGNNDCVLAFLKTTLAKNIKYAIITEPTNLNVATSHKGTYTFEITFTGKSAHSSIPEKGINAIEIAAGFITYLKKYKTKILKRRCKELGTPTLNIGVINGGIKANIVPERCVIKVNRRTLPGRDDLDVFRELRNVLGEYDKRLPKLAKTSIVNTFGLPPLETRDNSAIAKLLLNCGAKQLKKAVDFSTEASLFASRGIQGVVFGPGSILQAHTSNEFVSIKQLEKAKKIYINMFSKI